MNGILYGVGVGPGDPELLTIQAVRTIREADIIFIPKKQKENCRAYQIALQAVPELAEKETVGFDFPMVRDAEKLRNAHREIWQSIKEILSSGKSAAFLTIGDPLVYSTFAPILEQAKADNMEYRVISGVPSFIAAAAVCGVSLATGNQPIQVLSGQEDVYKEIKKPGTKILMKCGHNILMLKTMLSMIEQSRPVEILAVKDCGMPEQEIYYGADAIPEDDSYMLTVIIRDKN